MNANKNLNNTDVGEQQMLPSDQLSEAAVKADSNETAALRAENEQLKTTIRLRDARDQITDDLKAAGARSPELIFEAAKEALQFADDGSLANAAAVVGDLKRKFPEQFGVAVQPSVDAGAGTAHAPNILTKSALAKMKPDEIARLDWADVRQVLSN